MPFIPIANATQVNVTGTLMDQLYENVWHVQTADPPTAPDLLTVASIFETAYGAILNGLSQELRIAQIECRYLGNIAGPIVQLFITPPIAGSAPVESVPGNVAFVIKLSSALPGRQFRGRKYFAGFVEADVSFNLLDGTRATAIAGSVQDLITALATNGTPLSVVSKTHGTIVPVVSAGYVDLYLDSQRRRLPGRGR
jgi:hypothetical protein